MKIYLKSFFLFFVFISAFGITNNPAAEKNDIYIVSNITLSGNKKTKDHIILRELTFASQDTIHVKNLNKHISRTKSNLLNLSLFNFVTIDTFVHADKRIDFLISVEERWYIWPYIYLDFAGRNFSEWWKSKDYQRLEYGLSMDHYNFRGRNQILKAKIIMGYPDEFSLVYRNLVLDKKQHHFLHTGLSYSHQNSLFYRIQHNELLFYLGEAPVMKNFNFNLGYTYRPKLYRQHKFDINFQYFFISDTILTLNPNFLGKSRKEVNFFSFHYQYYYDLLDSKIYPKKGKKIHFEFKKKGLRVFDEKSIDATILQLSAAKYFQLHKRWYTATAVHLKKSFPRDQPFIIRRGLGYLQPFHGFEFNVIDGQDYVLFQHLVKFTLLPTQIIHLKFIPLPKFNKVHLTLYANAFADAGYVWDSSKLYELNHNTMANEFLYSGGLGIDLVSYYDKIFRFEYAINKYGISGFYIHFIAPI